MKINYILTTSIFDLMPQDDVPEIMVVGRSNVGKSTLINLLGNSRKLAKTSKTPGKTRALSFFDLPDIGKRMVDVPGYGYAKTSNEQKDMFARLLDGYFQIRDNLEKVIVLLDSRRGVTDNDKVMIEYLISKEMPFVVVGTKLDKINQSGLSDFQKSTKKYLGITPVMYSSLTKKGLKEIEDIF